MSERSATSEHSGAGALGDGANRDGEVGDGAVGDGAVGDGAVGDGLVIAGRVYGSRLLVGTGKFASHRIMRDSLVASGAEIVTVALRRVDLSRVGEGDVLDFVPPSMTLLPNTSGAVDAAEALRLARLGRAATGAGLVKLEVTPDPRTLAPDPVETLRAAELMVADGFTVLPYCSADPILARRLEEAGCATVMPLGSWIGSSRGLRTRDAIEAIVAGAGVPVVVDAGLGVPSDAAEAMEIGADAVLVNTAIAVAADPVTMARAFALATRAGRLGFLAGRGAPSSLTSVTSATSATSAIVASASSPLTGFLAPAAGAPARPDGAG